MEIPQDLLRSNHCLRPFHRRSFQKNKTLGFQGKFTKTKQISPRVFQKACSRAQLHSQGSKFRCTKDLRYQQLDRCQGADSTSIQLKPPQLQGGGS